MQVRLVALELTRAYLTECDTRAVVGVDISGNLKDKSSTHIRLSYATSMENITKGLDRIEEFLKTLE